MKKIFVLILGFALVFNFNAKADEGMWLLSLIHKNYDDMKAQGLRLTAEDIYNINQASLKDAIGGLSNSQYIKGGQFFCSGEVISDKGLILTNHHCGYGYIQKHSTVEHDYLKDGFWAKSHDQELMNEDMTVSFLIRMEDVSDAVLKDVTTNLSETDRKTKIGENIKEVKSNIAEGKDKSYTVMVKPMFEGNQYFVFIYETFKDVRLVGAPPESIGKYGSDTDNWVWPRHTGDFSMFRVYMSPDGKPAKFAKENVPYKPKKFLPISLKGVKPNDFAMIMGFPGSTERYLTSYGVDETIETINPIRVNVRTKKLNTWKKYMDKDHATRLQYASKYASSANYWKYSIGQNKALKRLKVYDERKALEDKLSAWIEQSEDRKEKYGEAINLIEQAYNEKGKTSHTFQYILEAMLQGSEIVMLPASMKFGGLASTLENTPDNAENIKALTDVERESATKYFKDYNATVDKDLFATMAELYYNEVAKEDHFDFMKIVEKKYKGDFHKYAEKLFDKSIFASKEKLDAFLDKPSLKVLKKDMAYKIMDEVISKYIEFARNAPYEEKLKHGKRLFEAALLEMNSETNYAPDANSTIRLTYGQVGDYSPADAVHYKYYTTLKGVMEKEDPDVFDFKVAPKLKELYNAKDYGQYANADGTMPVCFTTNNDITGGNSGSGVINGDGELIGTAFDGNWEAMSGDIQFEHKLQKCINVDIRYTLFIIDKFAGATNLINEMKIVR